MFNRRGSLPIAILLQEEGLYHRCRIYATDMNEVVLRKAKAGIFPLGSMNIRSIISKQAASSLF